MKEDFAQSIPNIIFRTVDDDRTWSALEREQTVDDFINPKNNSESSSGLSTPLNKQNISDSVSSNRVRALISLN